MVVSDTSPLNYLVLIEQIDILSKLYGRVLISQRFIREDIEHFSIEYTVRLDCSEYRLQADGLSAEGFRLKAVL